MKNIENEFLNKNLSRLSSKSNPQEVRYYLMSIYGTILQSTSIFSKNIDIKPFVNSLPLEREMRDYLFSARPAVIARIIKEINKSNDKNLYIFLDSAKKLIAVNPKSNKKITKTSKKNHSEKNNYIDNLLNKYSRSNNND
ncbi:hypothetical protein AB3Z09_11300 [Companilactobacillus farciminis]|uniref:hypothetical protein n=1 Tax=Companilactobacillus farciminis TaxID=1612 RepID=UPI0034D5F024